MADQRKTDGQGTVIAAAVLAIIEDDLTSAEERVLMLVQMLDLAVIAELRGDRYHAPAAQLLARAVAAAGLPLLARDPAPHIAATRAAAEAYARVPDDDTQLAYFTRATDSYGYGSGEGCYAIGDRCEPGSGCQSGAGTLVYVAWTTGFDAAIEALAGELAPRLRAQADGSGG
jgi:hypothetical protein